MTDSTEVPEYFQDEQIPQGTRITGWAALVRTYGVAAPVRRFACVSNKHVGGNRRTEGKWEIFDKRYLPENSFAGHLNFAFRHENIDLLIMKRVFDSVPEGEFCKFILSTPTGSTARRVWFFYEFLTGKTLDIKDADLVTAIDALDPKNTSPLKGGSPIDIVSEITCWERKSSALLFVGPTNYKS